MTKPSFSGVVILLLALLSAKILDAPRAAAACPSPAGYQVTELPGLGGPVTQALALNDAGQAAGWALDANWSTRAVLWNGPAPTNLSGNAVVAAQGVSSDGRVAGWQSGASGQQGAVWSSSGVTLLRALRGHIASAASDVNNAGNTVGWSTSSVGDPVAVVWRGGLQPTSLIARQGDRPSVSYAFAINSVGQIVGRGDFSTAPFRRALLWSSTTTMATLPGLGGGVDSTAAISDNGNVAGGSLNDETSKFHAVLWVGGAVQDLGLFLGVHPTAAYGVNDCGAVVGDALVDVAADRTTAIVWHNGLARELSKAIPAGAGWDLRTARAINSQGQIVGFGFRSGFSGERSFLLTPTF